MDAVGGGVGLTLGGGGRSCGVAGVAVGGGGVSHGRGGETEARWAARVRVAVVDAVGVVDQPGPHRRVIPGAGPVGGGPPGPVWVRRTRKTPPKRRSRLLLVDARSLLEAMRPSMLVWPAAMSAHRDAAVLLMGFAGAHRRSELVG